MKLRSIKNSVCGFAGSNGACSSRFQNCLAANADSVFDKVAWLLNDEALGWCL